MVTFAPSRTRAADDLPFGITVILPLVLFLAFSLALTLRPDLRITVLEGELGVLENSQAAILLLSLIAGLVLFGRARAARDRGLTIWAALLALGSFYMLGEEISWGQHYIGWAAEGWFAQANDQQETNLHNTSAWFDQKPRALLETAIYVGGMLYPLVTALTGRLRIARPWWLMPTFAGFTAAVLVLVTILPEWLHLFGFGQGPKPYRAAEQQELFIYLFVLLYTLSLLRRLRDRTA
ncbi:hypothetical protein [Inquilinus sp.]|uniref:hypothetical protein n=1 Tax=Inquilinus sp. TaxID=1932117 RepID=UPI0031CFF1C7